jgi:hypothetical protein
VHLRDSGSVAPQPHPAWFSFGLALSKLLELCVPGKSWPSLARDNRLHGMTRMVLWHWRKSAISLFRASAHWYPGFPVFPGIEEKP